PSRRRPRPCSRPSPALPKRSPRFTELARQVHPAVHMKRVLLLVLLAGCGPDDPWEPQSEDDEGPREIWGAGELDGFDDGEAPAEQSGDGGTLVFEIADDEAAEEPAYDADWHRWIQGPDIGWFERHGLTVAELGHGDDGAPLALVIEVPHPEDFW